MVRSVPVAVAEQTQEADNSSSLFPSESSSGSLRFPSFLPQSFFFPPAVLGGRSSGGRCGGWGWGLRLRLSGLFLYQSVEAARDMLSEADMLGEEGLPLFQLSAWCFGVWFLEGSARASGPARGQPTWGCSSPALCLQFRPSSSESDALTVQSQASKNKQVEVESISARHWSVV